MERTVNLGMCTLIKGACQWVRHQHHLPRSTTTSEHCCSPELTFLQRTILSPVQSVSAKQQQRALHCLCLSRSGRRGKRREAGGSNRCRARFTLFTLGRTIGRSCTTPSNYSTKFHWF